MINLLLAYIRLFNTVLTQYVLTGISLLIAYLNQAIIYLFTLFLYLSSYKLVFLL